MKKMIQWRKKDNQTIEVRSDMIGMKRKMRLDLTQEEENRKWRPLNIEKENLLLPAWIPPNHVAEVSSRVNTSLLGLFLEVFDEEMLFSIWSSYSIEHWRYRERGFLFGGNFNIRAIYMFLAYYIRITGRQNGPKENVLNDHPLRNEIKECFQHFSTMNEGEDMYGVNTFEQLFSKFLIPYKNLEDICYRFRRCLQNYGRIIAGDEKLFPFTGDNAFSRKVMNKQPKVGLWLYELCCNLADDTPYLLYSRLNDSDPSIGKTNPTVNVVTEWCGVALERSPGVDQLNFNFTPILYFDSYYTTEDAIKLLNQLRVPFIGSVNPQRFGSKVALLEAYGLKVSTMGKTGAIYNEDDKQTFVNHYSMNGDVGNKYVVSNCHTSVGYGSNDIRKVPVYDDYKVGFNVCDKFNRRLHHKTFPFRCGGGGVNGLDGQVTKFIMGCVLENVINLNSVCPNHSLGIDFKSKCDELSENLFVYALSFA